MGDNDFGFNVIDWGIVWMVGGASRMCGCGMCVDCVGCV